VDNLTHTLTGLVLARAGLDRWSRRGTAALVIGSNLPDADSAIGFYGSLYYLEHHRGLTHSLLGLGLLSAGLAGLLSLGARRGSPEGRRLRPLGLLALSLVAQALHICMDYLNSYGVRPFLPWSGRWFFGDLAFIIDPWMWLVAGVALFVSGPRRRGHDWAWTVLGLATGLVVVLASLDPEIGMPRGALLLWLGTVAAALILRFKLLGGEGGPPSEIGWRKLAEPRLASRIALCGLGLYGLLLGLAHRQALLRVERAASAIVARAEIATLAALPTPANPFRWVGVVETREFLFVDSGRGFIRLPRHLDEPAVQAVRAHCAGAALFRFFRFPVADIAPLGRGFEVVLRDARYRRDGRSGFGAAALALGPDLSVTAAARCPPPAAWSARRGAFFSYCLERTAGGRICP
jgi:inner membrane protein